jgi:hypothetical protein
MSAVREPIGQRFRGPATAAGMPTVLLSVDPDAELSPAVSITLDEGPAAVPVPEHLWRRYEADRAAMHNTEARVLAWAERWRRERDQDAAGDDEDQDEGYRACQVCGRPRAYPACQTPVAAARVPCVVLWGGAVTR